MEQIPRPHKVSTQFRPSQERSSLSFQMGLSETSEQLKMYCEIVVRSDAFSMITVLACSHTFGLWLIGESGSSCRLALAQGTSNQRPCRFRETCRTCAFCQLQTQNPGRLTYGRFVQNAPSSSTTRAHGPRERSSGDNGAARVENVASQNGRSGL